jgi:hypothetical protein
LADTFSIALDIRAEFRQLKEALAKTLLETVCLKKA